MNAVLGKRWPAASVAYFRWSASGGRLRTALPTAEGLPLVAGYLAALGMTATMRVLAGTSGFSYKEWKGSFYPEDLPAEDMLRFYASKFPAVETTVDSKEARAVTRTRATVTARRRFGSKRG